MLKSSLPTQHVPKFSFFPLFLFIPMPYLTPFLRIPLLFYVLTKWKLGFDSCPVSLTELISLPLGHLARKGDLHNGLFSVPKQMGWIESKV